MNYELARQLRRNQTPPEVLLWSCLRKNRLCNTGFRRQHPIGPYVVDFYCFEKKLIIEVDGEVHSIPEQMLKDRERQQNLEAMGFHFLRFKAKEVMSNLEGVLASIELYLTKESVLPVQPHPQP